MSPWSAKQLHAMPAHLHSTIEQPDASDDHLPAPRPAFTNCSYTHQKQPLQTLQVPPMPPTQVQAVLEHELGAPLRDVFEWIDLQTPLGSASISQVSKHCCTPSAKQTIVLRCLAQHSRSAAIWRAGFPLHAILSVAAVMLNCPLLLQVHMACLRAGGQKGRRQKPEAFVTHRVQQGETAAGIASLRGLVVADLEQANPG